MTSGLGSRAATRAVTLIAVSSTAGIVSPRAADESCGGMAMVAIQCGCKVSWIGLGILTFRGHTIMAGFAVINDTGMIEASADEATGCMTDATILVCWYMAVCFTYGIYTIMAGATVIHDANMIKGCWSKASGLVAVTAITVGWHMVRWRGFASGGYAIMTSCTAIHYACVIKFGTGKCRGVMTCGTIFAQCINMAR